MKKYIPLDDVVAEINRVLNSYDPNEITSGRHALVDLRNFLDTLEVKEMNNVWHNIDDIPNFNLNGVSDLIIDSYYGHIYREAHYYTPERWDTHIGFNVNRQFRWAYEKDLIDFD